MTPAHLRSAWGFALPTAALATAPLPALAGKGIVGRHLPRESKEGSDTPDTTDNNRQENYRNKRFATGGQKQNSDPMSHSSLKGKFAQRAERKVNAGIFISRLGMKPGMTIADIGAGPATYTEFFARAVQPGGQVWASEPDLYTVRMLYRQVRAAKLQNVTVLYSYYDDSLLPADTFDMAFLANVHLFAYPKLKGYKQKRELVTAFYKTVARGLKPDGRLVIFEHISSPMAATYLPHVEVVYQLEDAGFRLEKALALDGFKFNFHTGCHFLVFRKAPEK